MEDSTRYIALGKNQYFDSQQKLVVEKTGDIMKAVAHDRRRVNRPVPVNRRVLPTENDPNWVSLGNNLFFDKQQRVVMKKMGAKMVLFSRDRRRERKDVSLDRRKDS